MSHVTPTVSAHVFSPLSCGNHNLVDSLHSSPSHQTSLFLFCSGMVVVSHSSSVLCKVCGFPGREMEGYKVGGHPREFFSGSLRPPKVSEILCNLLPPGGVAVDGCHLMPGLPLVFCSRGDHQTFYHGRLPVHNLPHTLLQTGTEVCGTVAAQ